MSTTITSAPKTIAVLDLDAPAKVVHFHTPVREPDFYDDGFAYWIGDDATIGVDLDDEACLPDILDRAGWLARTGRWPDEFGIAVYPYCDVTNDGAVLARHGVEQKVWSYARQTCQIDA